MNSENNPAPAEFDFRLLDFLRLTDRLLRKKLCLGYSGSEEDELGRFPFDLPFIDRYTPGIVPSPVDTSIYLYIACLV